MLTGTVYAEDTVVVDVEPYTGWVNANSPLYMFKIALEKVNIALTLDPVKKLEKQQDYAQLRLQELKTEMNNNRTQNVNTILNQYQYQYQNINKGIEQHKLNLELHDNVTVMEQTLTKTNMALQKLQGNN